MKGIVFNLLEKCVTAEHGEDMWDDLLEATGLNGAYTSLGSYDDDELRRLLRATSTAIGLSVFAVEQWFGRTAMAPLAGRYPEFFQPHSTTCSFVRTLNDIIHPEVRKLYPGADVPVFEYEDPAGGKFRMRYRSRRKMCAFAEGLILGAADYYRERAEIEQSACMLRGDESCTLVCTFTPLDADG